MISIPADYPVIVTFHYGSSTPKLQAANFGDLMNIHWVKKLFYSEVSPTSPADAPETGMYNVNVERHFLNWQLALDCIDPDTRLEGEQDTGKRRYRLYYKDGVLERRYNESIWDTICELFPRPITSASLPLTPALLDEGVADLFEAIATRTPHPALCPEGDGTFSIDLNRWTLLNYGTPSSETIRKRRTKLSAKLRKKIAEEAVVKLIDDSRTIRFSYAN